VREVLPCPPRRPRGGLFALSEDRVLLLQAALGSGEAARAAFREWSRDRDLSRLDVAEHRALPLVAHNLDRIGVDDDPQLAACRKVARFNWLRSEALTAEVSAGVAALEDAGIPVMLLKGAAVVHHAGGELARRPMDDVDAAVHPRHAAAAFDVLASQGFRTSPPVFAPAELAARMRALHGLAATGPRGAELDLHWHVLNCSLHPDADTDFWSGRVPARLAGAACSATCLEDTIVNVVVHAAWSAGMPGLRWATDVTTLVRAAPPPGPDWSRVLSTARRHRVGVVVADALRTVRDALDVDVPDRTLRALRRASVVEHLEAWPRQDRAGRPRLPSTAERAAAAYADHVRTGVGPDTRARWPDAARFLARWWSLPSARDVPRHAVFVAAGRPWWVRALGPAVPAAAGHPCAIGEEVGFGMGQPGQAALLAGWSCPEPGGTWSVGAESLLGLRVVGAPAGPLRAMLTFVPFLPDARPRLRLDVVVNGVRCATWTLTDVAGQLVRRGLPIPARAVGADGSLGVRFVVRHPLSPDAAGQLADTRPLGVLLHSLRVDPGTAVEAAPGAVGLPAARGLPVSAR
jgi:hypothetical protein